MKALVLLAAATALSGCLVQSVGGVNPKAVYSANSVDEIIALGGIKLIGPDLESALSGQQMVEPNEAWTWVINEDNSHFASADDGEWADAPGGQWQIVNDQFCRENEDLPLRCSDVYQIGPFYRFTEEDGSLALWTVTQG